MLCIVDFGNFTVISDKTKMVAKTKMSPNLTVFVLVFVDRYFRPNLPMKVVGDNFTSGCLN